MEKRDIQNKDDVALLVNSFYTTVREDDTLGPIFNSIISDWEEHLSLLIEFWTAQLFLKTRYRGNPLTAHIEVDRKMEHHITPAHFGLWLRLWFATIDELFEGETAWVAKNRARKMSTMLYLKIFEHRSQH